MVAVALSPPNDVIDGRAEGGRRDGERKARKAEWDAGVISRRQSQIAERMKGRKKEGAKQLLNELDRRSKNKPSSSFNRLDPSRSLSLFHRRIENSSGAMIVSV